MCFFHSKEPGESINKDLKSFQLNHAPQTGAIQRNVATFDRLMDRSDPEILRHYNFAAQKSLDRATQLPRAVSEIKKMSKVYDYNPKFLHWSKVKMSPQSKFFN